jgi:uncharacterized membrane protein
MFLPAIGVLLSVLLVWESMDEFNPLIKKICASKKNKNVNCSSILSSKDAFFLGIFSWSDIGLVYFISVFLINLLNPNNASLTATALFSFLSFPYVFYSILYQKFVARSWCRLCLGVQAVLASLFAVAISYVISNCDKYIITLKDLSNYILTFSIIVAIYMVLKPLIRAYIENRSLVANFRSLKFNEEIKQLIFNRQIRIDSCSSSLKLGNPGGNTTITLIINPVCNPCMNELRTLLPILKTKDNTKIEVVFLTDKKEDDPMVFFLAEGLIAEYRKNGKYFLENLYDYVQNYPSSKYNHKFFNQDEHNEEILLDQINWCVSNKIFSTPMIFINYKQLPDIYSVNEIDYMCT